MYIRELKVQHLKRLDLFELQFPAIVTGRGGRKHVPWTVLIGENGTCKTAILQAIAMAAAGGRQVNNLVGKSVGHLVDRRAKQSMWVEAAFSLSEETFSFDKFLTGQSEPLLPGDMLRVASTLSLEPGSDTIFGASWYEKASGERMDKFDDPLDLARSRSGILPGWFVAAYGVSRILPDSAGKPAGLSATDRLKPLFDPTMQLTSTNFANYFADDKKRTQQFAKVLQDVLVPKGAAPLLPELTGLTLSGRGGITKASDLLNRHRFKLRLGDVEVGIPAVALAHGYQSTIVWIADLVGHLLLEAGESLRPQDMTGLVLVDEIDLYIHPTLQVSLIQSLKRAFPLIQFVVTTHSPLVLAALRPDEDEIVRLVVNPSSGSVERLDMRDGEMHEPDARIMTTAGIYQRYFGLSGVFGAPEGAMLAEYQSIASNPYRSSEADRRMNALDKQLREVGIDPVYKPVARAPGTRGAP